MNEPKQPVSVVGGPGRRFELTDKWILDVAETTDDELRAHQIALTLSYVAIHLDRLIHGQDPDRSHSLEEGLTNANWFHFATWANLTVTSTLRADGAPHRAAGGLTGSLRRRLTPAVLEARASEGQRVGRALTWGQRLIFVATCLTLLEFDERVREPSPGRFAALDPEQCERATTIKKLATWGDRTWFDPARHFSPMWRAFELYELAKQAKDRTARARLVLGGNLLLMAVDQDLVNPALSVVVDNVPQRVASSVDWRMARLADRLRGVPPQLGYAVLQSRHLAVRRVLETIWSRAMTDQVLVMSLPTETLRLGRDVPPRHRQWPYFPPALRNLRCTIAGVDPETAAALQDVARHVESLDRTARDGYGSGARDWRRWDERMNWAVTMMRSRQQDETLLWQPYSHDDEQRILAGRLPLRSGDPSALRVQPPIGLGVFPTAPAAAKDGR
jgi:hypothetical protein